MRSLEDGVSGASSPLGRSSAGPERSSPAGKKVRARLRAIKCVSAVLEGRTYQQVADELGYANRGTVHRIVQQALARHEVEGVEELRALELARLDEVQLAFWDQATSGDAKAAEVVLKVVAARCRLLQLHRGPLEPSGAASSPVVVVGGSKEQFVAALTTGLKSVDPAEVC